MQLQYIKHAHTGRVHLTDADSIRMVTLCGLFTGSINPPFIYGDETASGVDATCKTCQRVAAVASV